MNCATASWTAAVLCRFPTHDASESARGLAQSKTSRTSDDAVSFIGLMPLFFRGLWASSRRRLDGHAAQGNAEDRRLAWRERESIGGDVARLDAEHLFIFVIAEEIGRASCRERV